MGASAGGLEALQWAHDEWEQRVQERTAALHESEERYRALIHASAPVLYRMSPDWSEMRQLQGGSFIADTEKPNRNWLQEYIHSDDQPRVLKAIRRAVRTGRVFELEHRVVRVDGTLGWTFSRAVPLRNATGEIVEWFGAASDITARKQAEVAVGLAAQEWQITFDAVEDAVFVLDAGQRVRRCNKAARQLFRKSTKAILGRHCWEVVHNHRKPIPACPFRRMAGSRHRETMELTIGKHWYQVVVDPLLHGKGQVQGGVHIVSDISARKQAEATLRKMAAELKLRVKQRTAASIKSTAQLQAALVAGHAIAWELDLASGTLLEIGPVAELFGQPAGFLHGNIATFFKSVHPDDRANVQAAMESGDRDHAAEFRLLRPDGGIRWVATSGSIERDGAGRPIRLRGITRDITISKQAEEDRRRLERQVLEVTDREQQRIAHDLHDSIGQRLAAVKFMSGTLSKRLAKDKPSGALAAAQIELELQHTMEEVRAIARGLHPIRPDSESLISALYELAVSATSRFNLLCHFVCPRPVAVHDYNAATHLFRIAQEAVSNAARHARAKHIWIRLQRINGGIRLSIADDGCGLPAAANRSKGLGLGIMNYRASVIGATFAMVHRRGGGTRIICDWKPGKPQEKAPHHAP